MSSTQNSNWMQISSQPRQVRNPQYGPAGHNLSGAVGGQVATAQYPMTGNVNPIAIDPRLGAQNVMAMRPQGPLGIAQSTRSAMPMKGKQQGPPSEDEPEYGPPPGLSPRKAPIRKFAQQQNFRPQSPHRSPQAIAAPSSQRMPVLTGASSILPGTSTRYWSSPITPLVQSFSSMQVGSHNEAPSSHLAQPMPQPSTTHKGNSTNLLWNTPIQQGYSFCLLFMDVTLASISIYN